MATRPWLSHYDFGVPAHIRYPHVPAFYFLDVAAERCPGRPCLLFRDCSLTYATVARRSKHLAAALLTALHVRHGERIGLYMPNCPEFVLAFFAILRAGASVVAINPLYTPAEIARQVNDAGVETIFCAGNLYSRLKEAQPHTSIRRVIVTDNASPLPGDISFRSLFSVSKQDSLPVVQRDDVALLQYTGGTTGLPKGVVVLHRHLVANVLQFKHWLTVLEPENETFLLALPLYHIYGLVCGLLLGVALRARMVLLPDPRDTSAILAAIQSHRVSYFPAVPTLYNAINLHPQVQSGNAHLSSLKVCISGAAPLMTHTREVFEGLTGARIVEGYGLSEAPTATHCNPLRGQNRAGSIGLPLPDVDARIVSLADGVTELPAGEVGELVLRGPQVMVGYYNRPEETALALRDGWLYTGDMARMDADGYFYIVDRKKDLIKPGGMEVWPREVEEVINAHPKVQEAAVAGIPDEYRGETVKAWIVLRPGETLTADEVQAWCRQFLAPFKVPTHVEFRAALPKSGVGKILRRQLRQEEENRPL